MVEPFLPGTGHWDGEGEEEEDTEDEDHEDIELVVKEMAALRKVCACTAVRSQWSLSGPLSKLRS